MLSNALKAVIILLHLVIVLPSFIIYLNAFTVIFILHLAVLSSSVVIHYFSFSFVVILLRVHSTDYDSSSVSLSTFHGSR